MVYQGKAEDQVIATLRVSVATAMLTFFCLYPIPPPVMVYLGESGRAGNRHLVKASERSEAFFCVCPVPYRATGDGLHVKMRAHGDARCFPLIAKQDMGRYMF